MELAELQQRLEILLEGAEQRKREARPRMYFGDGRWLHSEKVPESARAQGVADACRLMLSYLRD